MGEGGVAGVISGAASSAGCAYTLRVMRQRKEVKIVSLMVIVCVSNTG